MGLHCKLDKSVNNNSNSFDTGIKNTLSFSEPYQNADKESFQ